MVLADLNGFSKSSAIRTSVGSTAWVIFMLPRPAFRFPDQAYGSADPGLRPGEAAHLVGVEVLPGRPLHPVVEVDQLVVDPLRLGGNRRRPLDEIGLGAHPAHLGMEHLGRQRFADHGHRQCGVSSTIRAVNRARSVTGRWRPVRLSDPH